MKLLRIRERKYNACEWPVVVVILLTKALRPLHRRPRSQSLDISLQLRYCFCCNLEGNKTAKFDFRYLAWSTDAQIPNAGHGHAVQVGEWKIDFDLPYDPL
jgi:hypothetical protein